MKVRYALWYVRKTLTGGHWEICSAVKFVKETKDLENNYYIRSVMCEMIQAMKKKVKR